MQLVPLLLVTDHDSGGYNMDDSEIGIALMSVAFFQLLWQVCVYAICVCRSNTSIVLFSISLPGIFVSSILCSFFIFLSASV